MCLGITAKKLQCKNAGKYDGYCHLHVGQQASSRANIQIVMVDKLCVAKVDKQQTSGSIPRCLGVDSFLIEYPVVNVVGSAGDKPPKQVASSWIRYYMKVIKQILEIDADESIVRECAVEGCTKHLIGGIVGAHVHSADKTYIVPFCRRHNSLGIKGTKKLDEEEIRHNSVHILDGKVSFRLKFDTRLVQIQMQDPLSS